MLSCLACICTGLCPTGNLGPQQLACNLWARPSLPCKAQCKRNANHVTTRESPRSWSCGTWLLPNPKHAISVLNKFKKCPHLATAGWLCTTVSSPSVACTWLAREWCNVPLGWCRGVGGQGVGGALGRRKGCQKDGSCLTRVLMNAALVAVAASSGPSCSCARGGSTVGDGQVVPGVEKLSKIRYTVWSSGDI
jgi:hypothetical protein